MQLPLKNDEFYTKSDTINKNVGILMTLDTIACIYLIFVVNFNTRYTDQTLQAVDVATLCYDVQWCFSILDK